MVYTYTPTYYTSLQDSITSICKTILPFSLKKRRHPAIAAAEQRLSKQQSDNLKWQQDSFHHILNLIGLSKEGIVPANEVSTFRTHLLDTLVASPADHEPPSILRDKLIFLQELLYAKCISEEEYHASKRPLLQRLAVQGAEIEARNVIVGVLHKETTNDEWSEIDLKDDKGSANQQVISASKGGLRVKRMKGVASVLGLASLDKHGKLKENDAVNAGCSSRSDERGDGFKSILMEESSPSPVVDERKRSVSGKVKKATLRAALQREEEGSGSCGLHEAKGKEKVKLGKRVWGFDGLKKWRRIEPRHEIAQFSSVDEEEGYGGKLVPNPVGEGPDTRQIKKKLHPNGAPADFFVDKVVAENIKKQLSRIRRDTGAHLTDDEIEAISTRLPADKADLNKLFPKSWCDQHGEVVLDVVRKEFKEHMREMGNQRHNKIDDENSHPNLKY
ncbi:uncharacterized protein LOC125190868 [Salvia hispanica]|uniref:uncharacterized protein LOC125190868 n=1 Tax=Salvia hispanica TaxID=49212 RepID=UPI0020091432|nr:uncharacterized protein LOC125190868 [Salvia hispanica]